MISAEKTAVSVVPPGYKQTEVGVIPEEWEVVKLDGIGSFSKGKGISKGDTTPVGSLPCIRYAEIYTDYNIVIQNIKSYIDEKTAEKSVKLKKNDILFAGSGETVEEIGKSVVFLDDFEAYVGGDTIIMSQKEKYNALYLAYLLNFTSVRKQLSKIGQGNAVVHIYANGLKNIQIPLPPLPEQQKIAAILTSIDNKIEVIDEQIAKTEMLKKGLMQKLLSEGIGHTEFKESEIGRIPKEWEVVRQGDVSKFFNGRAYKLSEWEEEGTPVIRLQNLTGSGTEYYYSTMKLPEHQYVYNGDLIYMWSATFGVYIWKGEKAIYHYHIWKVECGNNLDKIYMYYSLDRLTEQLKQSSHGATMLHITKGGMEKTLIALPSLKEQKQIAKILSTTDGKLDTLRAKKEKYETLKKGLMQKLLTGEVRVSV